MDNLERKSLVHVNKLLDETDTHNIYQGIQDILEKNGITDNAVKLRLKDSLFNLFHDSKFSQNVKEAKKWLEAILEDNEK